MYTGDLKPDLEVVCSADTPVDLDDATSVRIIGKRGDTIVFDTVPDDMTVTGDTTLVTRLWQPGDTADIGRIQIEVEATWPGNKKQTFRADGGVDVRRDFDAEALEAADPPPLESVVSDASINAVLVVPGGASRATIAAMVEDAVEAHTPGTELGFAERTSGTAFTTTATTFGASALVTGLVVTVTGEGRPVDIEFTAQAVRHSVAATGVVAYLETNGSAVAAQCNSTWVSSPSTTVGRGFIVRRRAVLTDGVVYTFKAGVFGGAAGTVTLDTTTFAAAQLSVTSR
jgi:hypothetical protein